MQYQSISAAIQTYLSRYWGIIALLIWGAAILGFGLVRFNGFHMEESSARALLLIWSWFEGVATPIPIAGLPDLRALLLIPAGVYWPGSIIAAKVFGILVAFAAATLLYRWSVATAGRETALIATAALLIAPLTIQQIDAVGGGLFMLLALSLSVFLDRKYRDKQRLFGGWYFSQLLLVVFAVSLHPAGLAYPLALAWGWYKEPIEPRQQKALYIGLVLAPLFVWIFHIGWVNMQWLNNPLIPLTSMVSGQPAAMAQPSLMIGLFIGLILMFMLVLDHRFLISNLLGRVLLLALLIGLTAADAAWAMLALVFILYRGTHLLLMANEKFPGHGLLQQRGLVLAALFFIATAFMTADKTYARIIDDNLLSPRDQLIQALAREASEQDKPFRAASQWPGRTMLVTKRYVLPLPPPAEDGEALLDSMRGITHLIFDHKARENRGLARNIAQLGGFTETLMVGPAGVIVKVRRQQLQQEPGQDK